MLIVMSTIITCYTHLCRGVRRQKVPRFSSAQAVLSILKVAAWRKEKQATSGRLPFLPSLHQPLQLGWWESNCASTKVVQIATSLSSHPRSKVGTKDHIGSESQHGSWSVTWLVQLHAAPYLVLVVKPKSILVYIV